jgi:hypothetical protein
MDPDTDPYLPVFEIRIQIRIQEQGTVPNRAGWLFFGVKNSRGPLAKPREFADNLFLPEYTKKNITNY